MALVFLHKAYVKGAENMEDKFIKITTSLWRMVEFQNQGPQLSIGAIQAKFKNILKTFRNKHGLRDDGERTNVSAIDEESSEMEINLEAIHVELEGVRGAAEKAKFRDGDDHSALYRQQMHEKMVFRFSCYFSYSCSLSRMKNSWI